MKRLRQSLTKPQKIIFGEKPKYVKSQCAILCEKRKQAKRPLVKRSISN